VNRYVSREAIKEAIRVLGYLPYVADLPQFYGLPAMEAGWISVPVGGRAPFFWF
jgi:hypothetical protein